MQIIMKPTCNFETNEAITLWAFEEFLHEFCHKTNCVNCPLGTACAALKIANCTAPEVVTAILNHLDVDYPEID